MFGVETLAVALALIKCCWVAKCLEKLFYEISKVMAKSKFMGKLNNKIVIFLILNDKLLYVYKDHN